MAEILPTETTSNHCDPCICTQDYYRDSKSWRWAFLIILCRIRSRLVPK